MTEIEHQGKGTFVINTTPDGITQTEVRMQGDSLWLSLNQISLLFQRDKSVVSRHIKNIFEDEELLPTSTVAFFATVQKEGGRQIERSMEYFNLDVILSIGYRVNSKQGTQFRIWANRILKEHLVNGYTLNQKRLEEQTDRIRQLGKTIALVERSLQVQVQNLDEARSIVKTLADFAQGLGFLDDYDHERLETKGRHPQVAVHITEEEFRRVVQSMRRDFDSDIFGQPKDDSFHSSTGQIYQAFGGTDIYPSIEHKAAMLLYFVVKNHSFVDGNKRIAAALFLHFLNRNGLLYRATGESTINNDGLAALTLLIAESKPQEMDTMVRLVTTILNRGQI